MLTVGGNLANRGVVAQSLAVSPHIDAVAIATQQGGGVEQVMRCGAIITTATYHMLSSQRPGISDRVQMRSSERHII